MTGTPPPSGIDTTTLFDLTGKTALVTGGSRGIGRMIAEGFAGRGNRLDLVAELEACERTAPAVGRGACHALPRIVADDTDRGRLVQASASGPRGSTSW